jgi:hypothetical protein
VTPEDDLNALDTLLQAYLAGYGATDDCCLVVACDKERVPVEAIAQRMREAVDRWGSRRPALFLLARSGLSADAIAVLKGMSALVPIGPNPGLRTLAATVDLPVIEPAQHFLAATLQKHPSPHRLDSRHV